MLSQIYYKTNYRKLISLRMVLRRLNVWTTRIRSLYYYFQCNALRKSVVYVPLNFLRLDQDILPDKEWNKVGKLEYWSIIYIMIFPSTTYVGRYSLEQITASEQKVFSALSRWNQHFLHKMFGSGLKAVFFLFRALSVLLVCSPR